MPKEVVFRWQKAYKCTECGLAYADKATAGKCESWCSENDSCNISIIKHALK